MAGFAMKTKGNTRPHIRMLRRRAGMTQRDLAALLGLSSHSQISRWENGTRVPASKELLELQVIFGVVPSGVFPDHHDRAVQAVVTRINRLKRTAATVTSFTEASRPSCKAVHLDRILESVRRQHPPGMHAHDPWPKIKNDPERNEL